MDRICLCPVCRRFWWCFPFFFRVREHRRKQIFAVLTNEEGIFSFVHRTPVTSFRALPTLLPSQTRAQTPLLGRPKMSFCFRRDPDFAADAPGTAQNDGFRRYFAAARFFADFSLSTRRPIPKAPFAPKGWLRNAAAKACCFAPQEHFFGLEMGTYGHRSARAGALDA